MEASGKVFLVCNKCKDKRWVGSQIGDKPVEIDYVCSKCKEEVKKDEKKNRN